MKYIKLDLGCGNRKRDGFIGVDKLNIKGVDVVHDLEKTPFPFDDNSCMEAVASHVVEHINPANGIFVNFMNEVWRIMKIRGEFRIITPFAGSDNYWDDPTHCNGCTPTTWQFFNPERPDLWNFYKPKPWKILGIYTDHLGYMDVHLEKINEK